MMEAREMISTKQAADILGVNMRTIIRWCENGPLAGEKQGRFWKVGYS